VSTLDGTTTGELRKVAAEIQEARAHAIDHGAIVITVMVFVALVAVAFPAVDNDRFAVDGSRWAMAAASVFTAAAFIVGSAWVVDRRGKKRADEVVGRLDAMGTILCHNGRTVDRLVALAQQTQIGMGMVSAQMEQLDARLVAAIEPVAPATEEAKELAMRSFETGRRIGRREAEG